VEITGEMTVKQALQRFPQTREVFLQFGVCDCCGGEREIRKVASSQRLDVESLLKALNQKIQGD
jgi:iron-sulfur cluster repair protein YtfE (RIC family)